ALSSPNTNPYGLNPSTLSKIILKIASIGIAKNIPAIPQIDSAITIPNNTTKEFNDTLDPIILGVIMFPSIEFTTTTATTTHKACIGSPVAKVTTAASTVAKNTPTYGIKLSTPHKIANNKAYFITMIL